MRLTALNALTSDQAGRLLEALKSGLLRAKPRRFEPLRELYAEEVAGLLDVPVATGEQIAFELGYLWYCEGESQVSVLEELAKPPAQQVEDRVKDFVAREFGEFVASKITVTLDD